MLLEFINIYMLLLLVIALHDAHAPLTHMMGNDTGIPDKLDASKITKNNVKLPDDVSIHIVHCPRH